MRRLTKLRAAVSTLELCNIDNGSYPSALGTLASNSYPLTGCTGQSAKVSSGTTMTYYPKSTTDFSAYILFSVNSKGKTDGTATGGYWCYASSAGGAIAKKTATTPTAYAAAC